MPKLTVDMLSQVGEYEANISKFQRMFGGKEMEVNSKNIIKASRKGLDMEWVASQLIHLFDKQTSLSLPGISFLYAKENGPDDETRESACREPIFAMLYAREVDKEVRDDTRGAAEGDWIAKYGYQKFEDSMGKNNVS